MNTEYVSVHMGRYTLVVFWVPVFLRGGMMAYLEATLTS